MNIHFNSVSNTRAERNDTPGESRRNRAPGPANTALAGRAQPLKEESLGKRLLPWVVGSIALAVVAVVIFYRTPPVQDTRMTTDIPNAGEIDTLTDLGGVPVNIFDQIGVGKLLRAGDSLKEVLRRDWKTIANLGITHINIANIIDEISKQSFKSGLDSDIEYNPYVLQNDVIGRVFTTQTLHIKSNLRSLCKPKDPFKMPHTWGMPSWCDYFEILNPRTNQTTGKIHVGMTNLIRKFGFYASGSYRVDPVQLVAVLTGQDPVLLKNKLGSVPKR